MLVHCNALYCQLCIVFCLILWYHVSGSVILPCDHLKHVNAIVYMSLVYCTANLSLNIK